MDVIQDVLKNGPIAGFPLWIKGILITIFSSIVCTLMGMLVVLLTFESGMAIQFGY